MGPSSFLKIKMLGKGDVGRVYLVREKKTDKLYAMKGIYPFKFSTLKSFSYSRLPFTLAVGLRPCTLLITAASQCFLRGK